MFPCGDARDFSIFFNPLGFPAMIFWSLKSAPGRFQISQIPSHKKYATPNSTRSGLLLGQPFSTQLSLQRPQCKALRTSAQGQAMARKCSHHDKPEEGAASSPGPLQTLGGFGQQLPRVCSLPECKSASPSSSCTWPLMVPPPL